MPVWRPEEGIGFPGAGVRQSELPDMGHGNKIRSSARAVQALPPSQFSGSLLFLFIGAWSISYRRFSPINCTVTGFHSFDTVIW